MTKIVESDRPFTEAEIDKLHAEAFHDLECRISDCVWMSVIAGDGGTCD